ncbi:MAG: DUF7226 domain-containing protein [Waterburya sp.]
MGRLSNVEEPLNTEAITLNYAFDVRQTNYYVSAANYLGLVNRAKGKEHDVTYVLSDLGQSIISQHKRKRNMKLLKSKLLGQLTLSVQNEGKSTNF